MPKKLKVIVVILAIAVVVTGIAVPLSIWGDDLGAVIEGVTTQQNIYTLAQVQEAAQAATLDIQAERDYLKGVIGDYELKVGEWQKKYEAMVAEKNEVIASLEIDLQHMVGYASSMEDYLLGAFSLLYDNFDSPELNNYLLEAFTDIKTEVSNRLITYNAELAKLPEDLQEKIDEYTLKAQERNELINILQTLKPSYEAEVIMLSAIERLSDVIYTEPPEGFDPDNAYTGNGWWTVRIKGSADIVAKYNVRDIIVYSKRYEISEFTNVNYSYLRELVEYSSLFFQYRGGLYDLSNPETFDAFLICMALSCQVSQLIDIAFTYGEQLQWQTYNMFAGTVSDNETTISKSEARIIVLAYEIADLGTLLYGKDGVDDGAIYDKGYYTALKIRDEGALAEINKKIEKLISEGATLNE